MDRVGVVLIIGLSGYARSGKDEVAKVLVERHGFRRVAFADKLRQMLFELNPIVVANPEHHGMVPVGGYGGVVYKRLSFVIDTWGWDGYKDSPFSQDVRGLLQRLGTEAGRNTLGENIWVDAALTDVNPSDKVVVTDVRFPNEYQAITSRGGSMWRISRPDNKPANAHPSENSLDEHWFSMRIRNNGSLEQLADAVSKAYERNDKTIAKIIFADPIKVEL